jgi:hypothetical protein
MKKVLVMVFAAVFVLSAGIFADMKDKGMDCGMMWMKADVKTVNTADGVNIVITSKDAKEVKEIQDGAAKMVEMCRKMKGGKDEGKEGMEGMWGRGMGMGNPMMMQHMQKRVGIVLGFLMVIWSLLIILLIVTIILVIKKIMAKSGK